MPSKVLSAYPIQVVGVHYEDEHGREQLRLAIREPHGGIHLLPEAIGGSRVYTRASSWLQDGVNEKLEEGGGQPADASVEEGHVLTEL